MPRNRQRGSIFPVKVFPGKFFLVMALSYFPLKKKYRKQENAQYML
jgi:hypothetical protein